MHLGRWKRLLKRNSWGQRQKWEHMSERALQTPRWGRQRRCPRCWDRDSPAAQDAESPWWGSCATAAHGGPHWSRDPPAAWRAPCPKHHVGVGLKGLVFSNLNYSLILWCSDLVWWVWFRNHSSQEHSSNGNIVLRLNTMYKTMHSK